MINVHIELTLYLGNNVNFEKKENEQHETEVDIQINTRKKEKKEGTQQLTEKLRRRVTKADKCF